MPLQYVRDDQRQRFRVTLTGDVTLDDLASFVASQITERAWSFSVLYDATAPGVTLWPLETVPLDLWRELDLEHGPRSPVAFAVADEAQRAIAGAYTRAAAAGLFQAAVFSDVAAAEQWLDTQAGLK